MKKKLFITVCFILFSISIKAQVLANKDSCYVYCELQQPAMGSRTVLKHPLYQIGPIKNENGEDLEFSTIYNAIAYMSIKGWDFVQMYTHDTNNMLNNIQYAILRKKVPIREAKKYASYEKRN